MSHSACKPVRDSVVGQRLDDVGDIGRIGDLVREKQPLDLLQADHTLSGIDMALWDLMGKRLAEPVYRLLGYDRAYPKTPYASQLFGDTPQETLAKGRMVREQGYRASKFGWGPFGAATAQEDADQLHAAREGLGEDGILLVDAGTVWRDDLDRAAQCVPALQEVGATWLEEPFVSGALTEYKALAAMCGDVKLAGGEGAHKLLHGATDDRPCRHRLCPNRRRPDRRHQSGQAGCRLCRHPRHHLREPYFYHVPGAQRIAAALCRAGERCDLRVPGGSECDGHGDDA